jgi:hypothetical protein
MPNTQPTASIPTSPSPWLSTLLCLLSLSSAHGNAKNPFLLVPQILYSKLYLGFFNTYLGTLQIKEHTGAWVHGRTS